MIFLSVASLSHVGHFIQYHRNTTPDNGGLCNVKVTRVLWFAVRTDEMGAAGLELPGSRAISEGLIRGDQVVSSTSRSQDS